MIVLYYSENFTGAPGPAQVRPVIGSGVNHMPVPLRSAAIDAIFRAFDDIALFAMPRATRHSQSMEVPM